MLQGWFNFFLYKNLIRIFVKEYFNDSLNVLVARHKKIGSDMTFRPKTFKIFSILLVFFLHLKKNYY